MLDIFKKKQENLVLGKGVTVKQWLPIKNIKDGVIELKNGKYIKIVEVLPINFKLKSKREKKYILINFRAFLNACRFPMHISIQCKKADIRPHIKRIESIYQKEQNENTRYMMKGYMKLVEELGNKGAVSRSFYLIFNYEPPIGIKNTSYAEVSKQLAEKSATIRDYLKPCGNEIIDFTGDDKTAEIADVLHSYLNRRSYEIQNPTDKYKLLTGMFLNMTDRDMPDEA